MKNKIKSYKPLYLVVTLVLLMLAGLFIVMNRIPGVEMISVGIVIVIIGIIFVGKILKNRKDVKKGHVVEDERSRKVSLLAGAKSFQISMWYLLVLMWVSSVLEIIPMNSEMAFGAGILGMAVIYGVTWFWANGQDDLDKVVRF